MAFNYFGRAIFFLIAACMLRYSVAVTTVVGGSEGWRFGYNYTAWALKHGRFHVNDTLVFQYAPPSQESRPHSVYLLPNLYSFVKCDFTNATLLSNASEGQGNGFSYVLTQTRPLYFASGDQGNGNDDCNQGMMKFFAIPLPRWFNRLN